MREQSVASGGAAVEGVGTEEMTRMARRVYDSIFELLPDAANPTPLVRINNLNPSERFTLYGKLEWFNPFGSVKDRAAWFMLRALEEEGKLGNGEGLVEPTSGNTGFSLAVLASVRGYAMRAVVPDRVPEEKKILLRIAGADLDVASDALCPSPGLGEGSINLARTRARAEPDRYVMPNQYANEQNVLAHYRTTGPEIWNQSEGQITHLFVSLGTCGTVTGTGRYLKEQNPAVRIIAVQPTEGHDVPGLRNVKELDATELYDPSLIDEIVEVDYELAYSRALDLLRREGIRGGPSSGLILEGARRVIERDEEGYGLMILPDDILKYTANMVRHLPELSEGIAP